MAAVARWLGPSNVAVSSPGSTKDMPCVGADVLPLPEVTGFISTHGNRPVNPSLETQSQITGGRKRAVNWLTASYLTSGFIAGSEGGCGSPVVKVSDHGRHVTSSSPVPLKTRRVGQRCTLNLSRAQTSSRWCGVVVWRGGASSGVVHVT
ncbi:uncharacterized protein TNCV_2949091 [Trichonephila clavipes]|nr:uncharacterized protein TNCV_2949091 [Trichonephila clavipes]